MTTQNSRFIIANITWNETGWRNVYTNPRAGHRYAREHPGHESLNFDFDKKGLDTEKKVFGFVQWVGSPKKLEKEAVTFFYSKNLKNQQNEIVGIYGNVEILKPAIRTPWNGFEEGTLISNIKADKGLSLLFSIPLNADKYSGGERLVPQAGFTYANSNQATRIIMDEIELLKKSGVRKEEYQKLSKIYEFITREEYDTSADYLEPQYDEEEQQELEDKIKKFIEVEPKIRNEIINELKALTPQSPELVEFKGKSYKRDNKTIAQLKVIRGFRCQICGVTITKKDGALYIEAAHIKPKNEKGPETPDNILILCPNHHKEFDIGKRRIIEHTKNEIIFEMNEKRYVIDLSLN